MGEVLKRFQNAAPDDLYYFGSEAKTCVKMLQGMLKQMAERLPKVKNDTERAEIEKCTKAIENLIGVLQAGKFVGRDLAGPMPSCEDNSTECAESDDKRSSQ